MKDTSIGQRILHRRKELGLTQAMIQQQTGISSGNLSSIERGNKLPSAPSLIRLSEVLNCSTDWILKGTEPAAKQETYPPLSEISSKNKDLYHVLEMYLFIDEDDQKEIKILLEHKYKRKETEKRALLSSLLDGINAG